VLRVAQLLFEATKTVLIGETQKERIQKIFSSLVVIIYMGGRKDEGIYSFTAL